MYIADGPVHVLRMDDHGYVPLGRPLRCGPDGYTVAAQGCEHTPRGPALGQDIVPDQAYYGKPFLHLERIELPDRNLVCKPGVSHFLGLVRILLRHCNTHGVYR